MANSIKGQYQIRNETIGSFWRVNIVRPAEIENAPISF
jgi:hypothetical protein